jgi:PAS domain S-box-containing protein
LIFNFLIIRFYLKRKNLNEQKLARAICLKKAALDANKDAILITDLNQKITDFNKPYLKLWGLSKEQMEERDAAIWTKYGLAKIKNKKVIKESLGRVLKNKAANSFDIVYLKDGRILENYTRPQILNGEIVGRVFNFSDVTERYTAAKKLRISENRLRNLFDYSPLGIVILEDNEKPFLNVNRQFCLMMGYTEKELLNKKVEDITFEKHHYIHSELYKKLQEGTIDEFKIKKKYVRKSGEIFWGNTNISVIRDIKGKIINEVIFIEDIHEQQEQEQRIQELVIELKLLNEALEHKIKLKTLDLRQANQELRRSNQDLEQFAYIASHDLQEPLRMIGNFVQLLERQYKDQIDEEGKEYIHYVVDGVNRMSKLIQNLLKYSRVGRKEAALRVVDLGKIIEAKLFGLSRKMQECNAKVKILDMPKQVYCEPDQIGMVFFNLMTNALKFNTGSPNIEIGFKEEETAQLFYIKDNGIGIDKRYETKVFEIFKRLHRREEYEGTGIGLALCKKIIDRHKGKIWFESELGEGTTFYFTISKNLQNEGLVPFDSNLISRGQ